MSRYQRIAWVTGGAGVLLLLVGLGSWGRGLLRGPSSNPVGGIEDERQVVTRLPGDSQGRIAVSALSVSDESDGLTGGVGPDSNSNYNAIAEMLSGVEATLYGNLDPNALVDAALEILDLPVSDKAIPEPQPDGSMLFPIKGAPEGVTAVLDVRRPSSNPEFKDVLTLEVTFDRPRTPYMLDGVVRRPPKLEVTCWAGPDGELKAVGILTQLGFSGESHQYGITSTVGEVVEGVSYLSRVDGTPPSLKAIGFQNGSPGSWRIAGQIENGHLTKEAALLVNQRLLHAYASVRGESER